MPSLSHPHPPRRFAAVRCGRLLLTGSAAALLLLAACDRQKGAAEQAPRTDVPDAAPGAGPTTPASWIIDRSHAGRPASTAAFTAPDDARVTLAQFRGKPVLVNLWATWCAPCVAEMPTLDRLAAARGEALTVLTVAQDMQGAAVVDPWFQRAGYQMLQPWLDPRNALLVDYNSPLPTTVLIDAQGREVWSITGALAWDGPEAAALIDEAVSGAAG